MRRNLGYWQTDMADYAAELLGGGGGAQESAKGPDYADSLLRKGQFSDSVMGRKIVPLQNREKVPEVGSLPAMDWKTALKYSIARTFKGDEDEAIANIITSSLPDSEVLYDVDPATRRQVPYISYQGKAYYINKPGLSGADVENIGGQVAAFAPSGIFASGARTLLGQAGRAAAGGAVTSVAGDVAADLAGADTGINLEKAAVNTALAPIAQIAGAKIYPLLRGQSVAAPLGGMTPQAAAALQKVGIDPNLFDAAGLARLDEVVKRLGGQWSGKATAATQGRAALADQEGIRLTAGQASGDLRDIAREEAMRNYARGKAAGDTMRDFDTLQQDDIRGAVQRGQARTGGVQQPRFSSEYDAGAALTEGVRGAERSLRGEVDSAYGAARDMGLEFKGTAIPDLKRQIPAALSEANVARSTRTTPGTLQAQKIIEGIKNSVQQTGVSGPMGRWSRTAFEDVDFRDLEAIRKQLNSVYRSSKANPEDARGVKTIIEAFDQWIDDAIDTGLATGDESAIAAMKRARELRTKYGTQFEVRKDDADAGRIMQKLINTDVSPNETMNLLFGYGELGQTPVSVRVAQRLKAVYGKETPEWNAYREAAFMRLLGGPQGQGGPQLIVSRIDRALSGRGQSLTREIFSEEEIRKLRSLQAAIKQTITPKNVANPSKTGYEVSRAVEDVLGRATGVLGLLRGDLMGTAATLGVKAAKDVKSAAAARSATAGAPLPPQRGVPGAIGAAAAGGDALRARLWQWLSAEPESGRTETR